MIDRLTLDRCRKLKLQADLVKERLRWFSPKTSVRMDSVSRGTTKGQPTESAALTIIELEERLAEIWTEYKDIADQIATECVNLKPMTREVILMRYVDGMDWPEIAYKLGYSDSYIFSLHRKALVAIGAV